jgi:hypothetical protein
MSATNKKPASISKPILAAEALKFAAESTDRLEADESKSKGKKIAHRASGTRIFFAPEGDTRLTINIKTNLHKRLKIAAIEKGVTAGELIEELLEKNL